jgi:alpha-glucosidase
MVLRKAQILSFTTLFRFGNPKIETQAILIDTKTINFEDIEKIDNIKKFENFSIKSEEDKIIIEYKMSENEARYGLGEALGSLNKRGKKYRLFATDDPMHTPDKSSLYSSHPFIISSNSEPFGLFIDYAGEIIFDIGFTEIDKMCITISSLDFDLYFFKNNDKYRIIKEFLTLTGTPYIPPKWAFGYQQCRWSYPNEKRVKEIAHSLREFNIPCDVIYTDIDYMEDYKVFTIDKKRFPNMANLIESLKKDGFHLVPIVDPGVKIEKGYSVYEEGIKENYFCKREDGTNFVASVWPGFTHFPDFLNIKTRNWWGGLYKKFYDIGIEGFWSDMNEPTIFFTPEGLDNLEDKFQEILSKKDKGFDMYDFFNLKDTTTNIANRDQYYETFFHKTDNGEVVSNKNIHNLYGFNMNLAISEGAKEFAPNRRLFIFSRSSYIGMHRFAALWTGDNQSWWEHIIVHIRMLQSLSLCGFFYSGADIGGFGNNTSAELLIRWTQLGIFSPLFRNHSSLGTRDQEPWAFDENTLDIIRDAIDLRYALLPYLYSEYIKATIDLKPIIRPLNFEFNDPKLNNIEDQFMFGDSIMVAPIHTPNARGRFIYIPFETKWLLFILKTDKDLRTHNENTKVSLLKATSYFIDVDLDEIPILIREKSIVVFGPRMNYVGEKNITELSIIAFVTDYAEFTYYDDDGETFDYQNGKLLKIDIKITKKKSDKKEKNKKEDYNKENDFDIEYFVDNKTGRKNVINKIKFLIYSDANSVMSRELVINNY